MNECIHKRPPTLHEALNTISIQPENDDRVVFVTQCNSRLDWDAIVHESTRQKNDGDNTFDLLEANEACCLHIAYSVQRDHTQSNIINRQRSSPLQIRHNYRRNYLWQNASIFVWAFGSYAFITIYADSHSLFVASPMRLQIVGFVDLKGLTSWLFPYEIRLTEKCASTIRLFVVKRHLRLKFG